MLCKPNGVANAARVRRVFCMEAMWTRFVPAVVAARGQVRSGGLAAVRLTLGNFAHQAAFNPTPQIFDRALAGRALLDCGV